MDPCFSSGEFIKFGEGVTFPDVLANLRARHSIPENKDLSRTYLPVRVDAPERDTRVTASPASAKQSAGIRNPAVPQRKAQEEGPRQ